MDDCNNDNKLFTEVFSEVFTAMCKPKLQYYHFINRAIAVCVSLASIADGHVSHFLTNFTSHVICMDST